MTHIPFKPKHGGIQATVYNCEDHVTFRDADLQPLNARFNAFVEMINALDEAGVMGRFACESYTDTEGVNRLAPYDIIQLDSVDGKIPERQLVDPAEIAAKLAEWFGHGEYCRTDINKEGAAL